MSLFEYLMSLPQRIKNYNEEQKEAWEKHQESKRESERWHKEHQPHWEKLRADLKSAANLEEEDQAWVEYRKIYPLSPEEQARWDSPEAKTRREMDRKGMGECVDCGKYTANRYAWWTHRDQVTQVLASQGQLKDFLCLDCLKIYGPIVSISHGPDGSEIRTEWDPAGAALKKALEKQKKENPENS